MSDQPLRIVSLEAQNVKRLRAVSITPQGNMVVIGGRNAQGKTSLLDAIAMALSGAPCERPINAGESAAEIVIDVGEFKLRKRYTASGNTLVITGADGARWSSPQTMLDKLIGEIAFDPLEFSRMKAGRQLEVLRELVGINTTLLDQSHATAFAERTEVNRRLKQAQADAATARARVEGKKRPEGAVSSEEIGKELAEAKQINKASDLLASSVQDHARDARNSFNQLESCRTVVERVRAELAAAEKTMEEWRLDLLECERRSKAASEAYIASPKADEAAIVDKLRGIEATNQLWRDFRQMDTSQEVAAKLLAETTTLTAKLETLEKRKHDKIAGAKYPVDGLRLGESGVIFQGVPFDQASAAEKLRVSVAMGLAMNPRLKVILIRDGSLLDADSLALIEAMAGEQNAQVWVERVGEGEECQVIIEDGSVKEVRS